MWIVLVVLVVLAVGVAYVCFVRSSKGLMTAVARHHEQHRAAEDHQYHGGQYRVTVALEFIGFPGEPAHLEMLNAFDSALKPFGGTGARSRGRQSNGKRRLLTFTIFVPSRPERIIDVCREVCQRHGFGDRSRIDLMQLPG